MKLVIWKDETHHILYVTTNKATWEYENDPDWLMTLDIEELIAAGPTLLHKDEELDGNKP